jgi:RimJ/RimL family protein N-acetyltransferase
VTPEDAEFILSLRLNPDKGRHLSSTDADLEKQRLWLRSCASDESQVYFIIEAEGRSVGTVRLYDQQGDSYAWGSWILVNDAPRSAALESTLMVYHFGLELGFASAHFDVRKGNEKVWAYHERFGAVRTSEDEENYYYRIDRAAVLAAFERYKSRFPDPIVVTY